MRDPGVRLAHRLGEGDAAGLGVADATGDGARDVAEAVWGWVPGRVGAASASPGQSHDDPDPD